MDILSYVTPEKVMAEYAKLYDLTGKLAEVNQKLAKDEEMLDSEKGAIIYDASFVAEKNQTLQDYKWRAMFPEKYKAIQEYKQVIVDLKTEMEQTRLTIESYNVTLRLFELIASLKTAGYITQ
jgi:hypothetical protein